MKLITRILATLLLLALASCAGQPTSKRIMKSDSWPDIEQHSEDSAWWYIQFIKQWPEDTQARFDYDVLLAEQVIRPTLTRHRDKIALWRFHRRAARDAAGSKFSFIYYAKADDAKIIADEIKANVLLKELQDSGLIEQLWIDDFSNLQRPNIADTSDKVWPVEIQNSWPYYIMGVSQSWLALIDQFTATNRINVKTSPLDEIVEYYGNVSERIDEYWNDNGGHAYIHHLSALFAYRPIQVRF